MSILTQSVSLTEKSGGIDDSTLADIIRTAENWADSSMGQMRQEISVDSGAGRSSLNTVVWKTRSRNIAISFQMLRYTVMLEKGAGRGYGGPKGSTWNNTKGEKRKTNPLSLNKMNTGARKAAPWFNPVIKRNIGDLADAVADHYAIQATKILIK